MGEHVASNPDSQRKSLLKYWHTTLRDVQTQLTLADKNIASIAASKNGVNNYFSTLNPESLQKILYYWTDIKARANVALLRANRAIETFTDSSRY